MIRSINLLSQSSARTAVFIDGPNLFAACKKLEFVVDFKSLLKLFQQRAQLIRAYYYAPVAAQRDFQAARPLLDWLDYNGFKIVTKAAKNLRADCDESSIKSNIRVEIAVDAMLAAPHIDHVVLVSGDGEFNYLVAALKELGKQVSVVSTLRTDPPMVSDELRRGADTFIELTELLPLVARSTVSGNA